MTPPAASAQLGIFAVTRLDPAATEMLGELALDYVCLDLQHGLSTEADLVSSAIALRGSGVRPIARVGSNEPLAIGRALDLGAGGVIVPMIESIEEARRAARSCMYPPAGSRSFGPVRASQGSRRWSKDGDPEVLCMPMIETAESLECVEEIVQIEGVSGVYVGPADLSLAMGLHAALDHPDDEAFQAAVTRIAQVTRSSGRIPAIHANAALARKRVAQGYDMVTIGTDISIMRDGLLATLAAAREEK